MTTLCLNMIVKNEQNTILRLLKSVENIIDTFCIVDTGSTDETVSMIMNFFGERKIKGKLGFTVFENFEKTRNYALKMAEGMSDYILLLDADMIFHYSFDKNKLDKDYYSVFQENGEIRYHNTRIVRNNGCFYYRGVTHEVVLSKKEVIGGVMKDELAWIEDLEDGGCKENKIKRDRKLLETNLDDEEMRGRYYFYLASTLVALGEIDRAIEYYEERLKLGGWEQELWCCCYRLGGLFLKRQDAHKAIFYFLEEYNHCPDRVENLYYLVVTYRQKKRENISEIYLNLALDIIKKRNVMDCHLFLEKRFYDEKMFIL